jgi:hypothetical protein
VELDGQCIEHTAANGKIYIKVNIVKKTPKKRGV